MCDFRLGLNGKVVITLDFLGEIYSSAAKSLDFMRVCESVVMNIGTKKKRQFSKEDCRFFLVSSLLAFHFSLFSLIVVSREKIREKREEKR